VAHTQSLFPSGTALKNIHYIKELHPLVKQILCHQLHCFALLSEFHHHFFNLNFPFMQHRSLKPAWAAILTIIMACLQSFTAKAGSESFEIYLNNKLIVRQAVTQSLTLQSLALDKTNKDDELVIYYNHCGAIGKGRTIAIKDDKGNTIKEWKFADATGSNKGMTIPVKELLQLEKNYSHTNLNLVYFAQQLPKGRALSVLQFTGKSTTWLPQQESWPVWTVGFAK
jgi:hypothetical protein